LSIFFRRLGHALTRNRAATGYDHWDPRLRGRTYHIPFEQVWQASLALARGGKGGLRRWTLMQADDYEGVIDAEAKTFLLRYVDDVRINVYLDEDAQTRVDLASQSRKGRADFGTNARRIARFLRALDRRLMPPQKKK
jgi:Zn-dependent M28 family amino/carboxypeptidase